MRYALLALAVVAALYALRWWRQRPVRAEAHRQVAAGATLLDVRTPAEFSLRHLPGARNVPLDQLPQRLRELGSKKTPLIVYCRSGARSARAAALLRERGFQQVLDLGPMSAW